LGYPALQICKKSWGFNDAPPIKPPSISSSDVPTVDAKTNDVLSTDVPTIDSKTNDILSTDVPTIHQHPCHVALR
jgi:hypothetical protein